MRGCRDVVGMMEFNPAKGHLNSIFDQQRCYWW